MDMGTYDGWENEEGRLPTLILDFIRQQLATHIAVRNRPNHPLLYIARDLDVLLEQGRIACIFDALDEMPQDSYQERYQAIKDFMAAWQGKGNRFVYSCRSLDYDPSFNVDEVIIDAFDRTALRNSLLGMSNRFTRQRHFTRESPTMNPWKKWSATPSFCKRWPILIPQTMSRLPYKEFRLHVAN